MEHDLKLLITLHCCRVHFTMLRDLFLYVRCSINSFACVLKIFSCIFSMHVVLL